MDFGRCGIVAIATIAFFFLRLRVGGFAIGRENGEEKRSDDFDSAIVRCREEVSSRKKLFSRCKARISDLLMEHPAGMHI